jgi:hypothetical protein
MRAKRSRPTTLLPISRPWISRSSSTGRIWNSYRSRNFMKRLPKTPACRTTLSRSQDRARRHSGSKGYRGIRKRRRGWGKEDQVLQYGPLSVLSQFQWPVGVFLTKGIRVRGTPYPSRPLIRPDGLIRLVQALTASKRNGIFEPEED